MVVILALLTGCGGTADRPEEAPQSTTTPASSQGVSTPVETLSPEVIDGFAIDAPEPGSWTSAATVEVSGSAGGLTGLTINGEAVSVVEDRFAHTLSAHSGVVDIEVAGVDAHGFSHFRRTNVYAGAFADPTSTVADAMTMRLNQGGLELVLAEVPTLLDDEVVEAELLADSEIYSSWAVDLYVTELSYDLPVLELELGDGSMGLTFTLDNLYGGLWYDALWDGDGVLSASSVTLTADLDLSVVDGDAVASISDATVVFDDFYFDIDYSLGIEHLLQGLIEDAVEDVLADLLVEEGGPVIEDALEALDMSYTQQLLAVPFTVSAGLADLHVDAQGLVLSADVGVSVDGAPEATAWPAQGYLASSGSMPVLSTEPDLAFFVDYDVINLLLYHAWAANLLNDVVSTEDGTLSPIFLGAAGATQGSLEVDAMNPPVLVAGSDGAMELQLGGMVLDVSTPEAPLGEDLVLDFSAKVPFTPLLESNVVSMQLGEVSTAINVRASDWVASPEQVNALVGGALPLDLVLDVVEALVVELPTVEGYGVTDGSVTQEAGGMSVGLDIGS